MKTRLIWPITALFSGLTVALTVLKAFGLIKLHWLWIIAAWWLPGAFLLIGLLIGELFAGNKPPRRN